MRSGAPIAAALLLLVTGCARCARPPPPPADRFVPGDASVAVVIPSLQAAREQATSLLQTLLAFPAAADLGPRLSAVKEQLGLDPLDARGLAAAGLDPSRGAALALDADGPALLVLPSGDDGALVATVARLARDRLGAARRVDVTVDGVAVTTFRTAEGAAAALALAARDGSVLVAGGAGGPARVAAASTLPAARSLSGSLPYGRVREALGPAAILAYLRPGSPQAAGTALLRDGAAVSATASATRLALRAVLLLAPERREYWRATVAPAATVAAATPPMPQDAFLVGRFEGDLATVARRALPVGQVAAPLARAGLDLERDLLPLLAPGATAALALAPTFQVAAVSRGGEAMAADPFQLVHLAAVLHVRDAGRAEALLDRLQRAGPRLGLAVARQGHAPRWRVAHGAAALDVALAGDRLLVAGGPGRLDALLAGTGPAYAPPTDAARAALSGGAAGGVLDLERLVASFRALPAAAYGTGPDAFVMRSLADRVIDPASRLVAAAARLDLGQAAATVDLVVDARPPAAPAAQGAGR